MKKGYEGTSDLRKKFFPPNGGEKSFVPFRLLTFNCVWTENNAYRQKMFSPARHSPVGGVSRFWANMFSASSFPSHVWHWGHICSSPFSLDWLEVCWIILHAFKALVVFTWNWNGSDQHKLIQMMGPYIFIWQKSPPHLCCPIEGPTEACLHAWTAEMQFLFLDRASVLYSRRRHPFIWKIWFWVYCVLWTLSVGSPCQSRGDSA